MLAEEPWRLFECHEAAKSSATAIVGMHGSLMATVTLDRKITRKPAWIRVLRVEPCVEEEPVENAKSGNARNENLTSPWQGNRGHSGEGKCLEMK